MNRILRNSLLWLALIAAVAPAFAGEKEDARARNAVRVLDDIRHMPDGGLPDKLLDEAHAIIVIPDMVKVGLVIGGRGGRGLLSVKGSDGTWSDPVFVKIAGGSIGWQAGVQSADVVLVFRNDRSLESIVNGKFTLGADAGVAAGPVGRSASAATDGQMKAEIWSWSRARGLFAGVALDGAVLSIDDAANANAYGNITPRAILENRQNAEAKGGPSSDVVAFRDELEEATYAARNARSGGATPKVTGGTPVASPIASPSTAVVPAQPPAQVETQQAQGFQSVDGEGVHTEPLKSTP